MNEWFNQVLDALMVANASPETKELYNRALEEYGEFIQTGKYPSAELKRMAARKLNIPPPIRPITSPVFTHT